MFFESNCKSCGGSGTTTVSMVEFVETVIAGLQINRGYNEAANKIMAIKAIRDLAAQNHLPAGLKQCKDFVEAIQTFESALRE